MIADLRGRSVLAIAVPPPLAHALDEAFAEHGASLERLEIAGFDLALEKIRASGRQLDALICGAASPGRAVASLDGYRIAELTSAIEGRAWLPFACVQRVKSILGRYPRYIVALSSLPSSRFEEGADFSAAGEAVLETLCRYANEHFGEDDARMNILRYRLAAESGDPGPGPFQTKPVEVASAAVALCSGLLDSMRGQVLNVDLGAGFGDNVFRDYEESTAPRR